MSEEAPKYHPVVEDAIETNRDSEDFGRVKDKDLAHDVALTENAERDFQKESFPNSEKPNAYYEQGTNELLKSEIAKKAVGEVMRTLHHNLAVAGAFEKQTDAKNVYGVQETADKAVNEAHKAGFDYDVISYDQSLKAEERKEKSDK